MARSRSLARRAYQLPIVRGGGGFPAISVYGNGVLIPAGDSTPSAGDHTDYGSTPALTTVTRTFTLWNKDQDGIDGTADLEDAVVSVSGSDYEIISQPTMPIAPGGSATFQVRCKALSVAIFDATISVTSSALPSPYDFDVTCNSTVWLYDTFTGTNNTNLQVHAPDINPFGNPYVTIPAAGSGGVGIGGGMKIATNRAEPLGGQNDLAGGVLIDITKFNFILDVDITTSSRSDYNQGVFLRYVDNANYFYAFLTPSANLLTLRRLLAGAVVNQTVIISPALAINTTYAFRAVMNGSSIVLTINGANALNRTDSNHATATKIGMIGSVHTNNSRFDNLLVNPT